MPAVGVADALRLYNVSVPAADDPGQYDFGAHPALARAVARKLGCRRELAPEALSVVRKSFDARARQGALKWVYVVDVSAAAAAAAGARKLAERPGQLERTAGGAPPQWEQQGRAPQPLLLRLVLPPFDEGPAGSDGRPGAGVRRGAGADRGPGDRVVVVGGGPAGLFAALALAEAGVGVTLLERGRPVEERALFVRGRLNPESNMCYGEGGAGTWSDGKLTTRIGRNSDPMRAVLLALHAFGAPDSVLVSGKPHLGTDRLIGILRSFRTHLLSLGVDVRFGARVAGLLTGPGGRTAGVRLADGSEVRASRVVLAVGHSARDVYAQLAAADVAMEAKPFAMGFRIEHPQALIDRIQYGEADAAEVRRGKGRYPVADYSMAAQIPESVAAAAAGGGGRGVYSFCMCPGELGALGRVRACGASRLGRRQSLWANSALVATVGPSDWEHLSAQHGALAGVELQRQFERAAWAAGAGLRGPDDPRAAAALGSLVTPAQRVVDFMADQELGVRPAPLHAFYPPHMTAAFRAALQRFDRQMPGFATSDQAVLHAAETRTSAPVRVLRGAEDLQSISMPGLYPSGEGAGYAGGIVSAAVDGLRVGLVVAAELTGRSGGLAANASAFKVQAGY
eukprot:scaffold10.g2424.t1